MAYYSSSFWQISVAEALNPDQTWRKNPWRTYPISNWLVDFYRLADSPGLGLRAVIRYRKIWENEKALDLLHDEERFEKWWTEQDKKTRYYRGEVESKLNIQEFMRHNNLECHKEKYTIEYTLFGTSYRKKEAWYIDLSEMKIKRGEKPKNDNLVCGPVETTSKYLDRPKANTIIKT